LHANPPPLSSSFLCMSSCYCYGCF
jgi:hypothetical protein